MTWSPAVRYSVAMPSQTSLKKMRLCLSKLLGAAAVIVSLLPSGVDAKSTSGAQCIQSAARPYSTISSAAKKKLIVLTPKADTSVAVDMTDYVRGLEKACKKNWRPPRSSTCSTRIHTLFRIDSNGKFSDIKLGAHSSHPLEEAAALSAIRKTAFYKPLPAGCLSFVYMDFTFHFNVVNSALDNYADQETSRSLVRNLERAESRRDRLSIARSLLDLARYEHSQQRESWARHYYEKAISTFRGANSESADFSAALFEFAEICFGDENFAEAEGYFGEGLRISEKCWRETGDERLPYVAALKGRMLCRQAFSLLYSGGDLDKAILLFDSVKVEAGKTAPADRGLFIDALAGSARCYFKKKNYTRSSELYQNALNETLRLNNGHRGNIAYLRKSLADAYFHEKEFDLALGYYNQAEKDYLRLGNENNWPAEINENWLACMRAPQKIFLLREYESAEQVKQWQKEDVQKARGKAYGWVTLAFCGSLVGLLFSLIFSRKKAANVSPS